MNSHKHVRSNRCCYLHAANHALIDPNKDAPAWSTLGDLTYVSGPEIIRSRRQPHGYARTVRPSAARKGAERVPVNASSSLSRVTPESGLSDAVR